MVTRATDPQYENNPNKFVKSQFKPKEWSRIESKVDNGSLSFNKIKEQLNKSRRTEADKKNQNSVYHQIRRSYEDNSKVVPNRVLAAETMADYFMHHFSSGFDISILDNIPYANVKLINYIDYRNQG